MKKTIIRRTLLCLLLALCITASGACTRLKLAGSLPNTDNGDSGAQDQTGNEQQQQITPPADREPLQGDPLPDPDFFRYGETLATGNVKYAYDTIKEAVFRTVPAQTVYFDEEKGLTREELRMAYMLFSSDYPDCFWLRKKYNFSTLDNVVVECRPDYAFSGEALEIAREELEAAVTRIVESIPSTATDSYAKSLYLHDTLIDIVDYEEVGEHQTAYGALVAKKAVCAGYAAAYQLLLQRANIPAYTVIGTSVDPSGDLGTDPIPHAWNAVWLTDDVCVFTDTTWNDANLYTYHYYFNISFEEMEQDHSTDTEFFRIPECNHDSYSYFDRTLSVNVNSSTTAEELAPLFTDVLHDHRDIYGATLYYDDESVDFLAWFNPLASDLTRILSGKSSFSSILWRNQGKEYSVLFKLDSMNNNWPSWAPSWAR